jgi:hypothetical protein
LARLFITSREIDFISDLTKEITKDIVGQKIYYYKVRDDLTDVHEVYEEAPEKVFDPPVIVDALVEWGPADNITGKFGSEKRYTITANLHYRDLLDKGIDVDMGDYFSYGDTFFEVIKVNYDSSVYGQIEHYTGITLVGKQARKGLIDFKPIGPTEEAYSDDDAIQDTFVQQRGFERTKEGETGDIRSLRKKEVLDEPISGPKEVSPAGGNSKKDDLGMIDSSFYGDD